MAVERELGLGDRKPVVIVLKGILYALMAQGYFHFNMFVDSTSDWFDVPLEGMLKVFQLSEMKRGDIPGISASGRVREKTLAALKLRLPGVDLANLPDSWWEPTVQAEPAKPKKTPLSVMLHRLKAVKEYRLFSMAGGSVELLDEVIGHLESSPDLQSENPHSDPRLIELVERLESAFRGELGTYIGTAAVRQFADALVAVAQADPPSTPHAVDIGQG